MALVSSDPDLTALFEYLLRLGDNCLILGHRNSEWCGHAPVLEEDIALANVALDMIGQTQLWLGLAGEIEDKGRSADDLAYLRDAFDFRNLLLVELPNGDFAHTLMRQFLFDSWYLPLLNELQHSNFQPIAEIAEKAAKEVAYHRERSSDLVIRLGDGSGESHRRMQAALDDFWSYTGEMLEGDAIDQVLLDDGIVPDPTKVASLWREHVEATLRQATLRPPETEQVHRGGKRGAHTEHLGFILAEMQFLQRAYPGARW